MNVASPALVRALLEGAELTLWRWFSRVEAVADGEDAGVDARRRTAARLRADIARWRAMLKGSSQ